MPAVRRDASQIVNTVRLLQARPVGGDTSPVGPAEGAAPTYIPTEQGSNRETVLDQARWEDIAEASPDSAAPERGLAVDVQRRPGDVVP